MTTNPTPPRDDAPLHGWLIHKAGRGWYRPNAQGYTSDTAQAGRYSHEDALSYSHPNGWDGPRDEITIRHESEVCRADQPARMVKPLVWEDDEEVSSAIGAGFEYLVELSHNGSWYHVDDGEPHSTREAAKAAAQADYEQRILAALTPAAQDDAERVAEAARVLLSDNEACLRFAEGFDREDAAQMGEPSPHIIGGEDYAAFAADRISCVKAGLRALGGRK